MPKNADTTAPQKQVDLPAFGSPEWEEVWREAYPDDISDDLPEPPSGTHTLEQGYTKLTPERVLWMLKVLEKTNNEATAARLGGISTNSFRKWKYAGKRAAEAIEGGERELDDLDDMERRKLQFYRAVEAVRGGFEVRYAERLQEVGEADAKWGDWRALKELMEWSGGRQLASDSESSQGGTDQINIAIRIDGGPPEGVDHEPEEGDVIEVRSDE